MGTHGRGRMRVPGHAPLLPSPGARLRLPPTLPPGLAARPESEAVAPIPASLRWTVADERPVASVTTHDNAEYVKLVDPRSEEL